MGLNVHKEKLTAALCRKLAGLCPFGAITEESGTLSIGSSCRLCRLCVKESDGAITFEEDAVSHVDKSLWSGVLVLCEHSRGVIHDVTYELLGKAKELADVNGQQTMAVMIGSNITAKAEELFCYGADKVFVYDDAALENFMIEPYTNVLADLIQKVKPSSILVGATHVGRSLAPRAAARLRCGLTADCTALEMKDNTDLVQIRPAFGGNIMARIVSPNTRPQFCTVRYKIFSKQERQAATDKKATVMPVTPEMLRCRTEIISVEEKPVVSNISDADSIVLIGRGVKNIKDVELIRPLAKRLGAQIACTRPLVEKAWFDPRFQIGLSGRTVKPKLLICIGVSGSVQTVAGLKGSDCIIAINNDADAAIFDVAHYGFVGDLYAIVPELLNAIGNQEV